MGGAATCATADQGLEQGLGSPWANKPNRKPMCVLYVTPCARHAAPAKRGSLTAPAPVSRVAVTAALSVGGSQHLKRVTFPSADPPFRPPPPPYMPPVPGVNVSHQSLPLAHALVFLSGVLFPSWPIDAHTLFHQVGHIIRRHASASLAGSEHKHHTLHTHILVLCHPH